MGHWGGKIERHEPNPEQIAEACREIQAGWGEQERLNRLRADWRPSYRRADGERESIAAFDDIGYHDARARLQVSDR